MPCACSQLCVNKLSSAVQVYLFTMYTLYIDFYFKNYMTCGLGFTNIGNSVALSSGPHKKINCIGNFRVLMS